MMKKVALLLNYQAIRVNISPIRNIHIKNAFIFKIANFKKFTQKLGRQKPRNCLFKNAL